MSLVLRVLLPIPCNGTPGDVTHICLSLCRQMQSPALSVTLTVPRARASARAPFVRAALPRALSLVPYRLVREHAQKRVQRLFLDSVGAGDVAYLWSEVPISLSRHLHEAGIAVVREKFNCHKVMVRQILDDAYDRLKWPSTHGISDAAIAKEKEELELADFICCPSPIVAQSLVREGVPANKLIATSYGWDPPRLEGSRRALPKADGVTVLFVGTVCVRKGAPFLLAAWAKSGIKGRLVLAGSVDHEVRERCKDELSRSDVIVLGHVQDIGSVFRSADVFAFPSLEEGSPLVSYEALGSSLPSVISPMAAGEIVRHGKEGLVVDPQDSSAWIEALRTLARSADLRRGLGAAALERSRSFTWQQVGQRRREALLARFPS